MLKQLNPGFLDRRISIQEKADSKDTDGFPLDTWTNLHTAVPAKRDYSNGGVKEDDGEKVPQQDAKYTIRYVSNITTSNRLIDDGLIYEIENVQELGRRQGLLLHCKWYGNEQ